MLNPDLVGRTFTSADSVTVTKEAIQKFAEVIGETNFEIAPPTFSISITLEQSQSLLQDSGLDWTRVVHGDQKFEIKRPIVAGDVLYCSSTIESARNVSGNEIVTVRSDLNSATDLVVSTWSTLVVRA
ncbi:MAG: MaoC family dehydratase N-terminal domain-containing protein [Actinobacteria bacterium]|jgi:acyl dehydratase|nr:MaoC family dehydratase N-terminal domain-containing protein [Actinomycetota bacterium]MDA2981480.1 MaoC family dehydratase N-terminal domain-containing protein [Actinomycetota bacterium]